MANSTASSHMSITHHSPEDVPKPSTLDEENSDGPPRSGGAPMALSPTARHWQLPAMIQHAPLQYLSEYAYALL